MALDGRGPHRRSNTDVDVDSSEGEVATPGCGSCIEHSQRADSQSGTKLKAITAEVRNIRKQARVEAKLAKASKKLDRAKADITLASSARRFLRRITVSPFAVASLGGMTAITLAGVQAFSPTASSSPVFVFGPLFTGPLGLFLAVLIIKADIKRREQLSQLLQELHAKGNRLKRADLREEVLEWYTDERES